MNEGIVENVVTGKLTKNSMSRLQTELITIIKREKAKAMLLDIKAMTDYEDSLAEVYFRVRNTPPDILNLPGAIVSPMNDLAYCSFYETTAANAGQKMKFFADIEAARAWLKNFLQPGG